MQHLQGFSNYPQKNFVKNFVSFEIILYLQHYSNTYVTLLVTCRKRNNLQ